MPLGIRGTCMARRDMHGKEGHGTIYAYEDVGDRIEVIHAFKFYLVCHIREAERLRGCAR